ncbi:MAG: COR domain-containing protein [Planctomycetota bacterium]
MPARPAAPTEAKAAAGYQEAQRRIAQAARVGTTDLHLSSLGLTSLPPEIGQLANLTLLYLNNNQLTSLPPEIGRLPNLTELNVSDNRLKRVPPEIEQLAQLTDFYLACNQLTSVPPEIGHLTQLTCFGLGSNQLTCVPPGIGQLVQLSKLWLDNNQLTSLPPEIGQLTQLITLDLEYNQLTSVPREIGQLSHLYELNLSRNQLTSLPESLRRLPQLRILRLHDNPKLEIPASVLSHGPGYWGGDRYLPPDPRTILDYYFRMHAEAERRTLSEAKLILVGRGDVGKTSLVRRLVDNTFSRQEGTTHGIRIQRWPVTVGQERDEILLHVWDFGGQEIMHATHQFFLTDRSLYLLVLDGRAGQQEAEADYWLRLISGFAPASPVLVVLNKIKQDHFTLNRAALQQKFPQVVGFIETDCDNPGPDGKTGKNGYGIDALKKEIARHVDTLPDVRMPFPTSWFAIKERLSKPKQQRQNFLTIDEYRALCVELGETNEESQQNLSAILHCLGIALNFSDDDRLHDKHVLNPHWLTTGIYTLLNSKRLAARKGEMRQTDLATELDETQYPKEMHSFLINLMEKFELCFSFEETPHAAGTKPSAAKYLIPELLDTQQPEAAAEFDPEQCLNFHYLYPVLPPGLLPRFIVRTHVLSEKDRWKTGVILFFEGNTALVKADPQEKTIRILINGPPAGRRRMLAMIRQDFDGIHRDIPNLKPDELVSFPSHPQLTVSFAKLEVLFDKNPDRQIDDVVDGEVVTATVRELLEGVEFGPLPEAGSRTQARRAGGKGSKRVFDGGLLDGGHDDEPLRLFFSYSHADAKQRLRLAKHLAPLERTGLIRTWYDNEILPGAQFNQVIADKLAEADIIVLLISANFTASDYCSEIELPLAMTRHEKGEACVLPILISDVNGWKKLPAGKPATDKPPVGELRLGDLNVLPTSLKAISNWRPNDTGWTDAARGVERAAEDIKKKRPPRPPHRGALPD